MQIEELLTLMRSEGLNPDVQTFSYDFATRRSEFSYSFTLGRADREHHQICFVLSEFEEMTREQVLTRIDKVRTELLLKEHFRVFFQKFCKLSSPVEQAAAYNRFVQFLGEEERQ